MTKKARKRKPAKVSRRRQSHGLISRLLKRLGLAVAVVLSFVFLSYLGYQDYTVRKLFEGKRWSIPARVYASPAELYAGYPLSAAQFENLLQLLRYRQDRKLSSSATYYRQGQDIYLKTRSFRFWDKAEPSRGLRLRFAGDQLTNIHEDNRSVALVRMDPAQIGSFYPTRKEDRILVQLKEVPETLVQGLLAVEDREFFQHHGLSIRGIARAFWANARAGGIVQGGSTITQQLVKNFFLTPERSLWRKFNEATMALIVDARYEKNEILEAYINEIYLGQDRSRAIHGFGLASEFYFDRPLAELELHHIALLVGLVRGPSYYDPWRSPERAKSRRNQVLDALQSQGYIEAAAADRGKRQGLGISRRRHRSSSRFPAFEELVRRQLLQEYREEDLTSEGLRIFTTLDVGIQQALEANASQVLKQLEKSKKVAQLEVASILTRREGGEVVALIGGRDPDKQGFNRALDAVRPIGSLIKPVVYLTALELADQYTVTTLLDDTAVHLKNSRGEVWSPKNYDRMEHGPVALHTALAHSYNLATVRLGMDVGIARTAKTLRRMGVSRPVNLYPSLFLGAAALSPLEVTQMYQTLAGDGFVTPLRAIRAVLSGAGEPLQRYSLTVRQSLDPAATYITNTILQEVMREGTGKSAYAYLPATFNVAGKTGTTNDLRDSWFAGFSGDYLGVVWMGRDDNKSAGLTGAGGALRLWAKTMGRISRQPVDLFPPEEVELVWIDPETGLKGNAGCPGAVQYPFLKGSLPEANSPCVNEPLNRARSWFQRFF